MSLMVTFFLIGIVPLLTSCGGRALDEAESTEAKPAAEGGAGGDVQSETECIATLAPAVIYTEPGCYLVPQEPALSFSHFQAIGCTIENNGRPLNSFTAWDELEPGRLVIEGCEFSVRFVLADYWRDWHHVGGAGAEEE